MLSFVSPCVLPLVPGYLSAISGVSGGVLGDSQRPPSAILVPAVIFCLSFTAIFVALGHVRQRTQRSAARRPGHADGGDRRHLAGRARRCSSSRRRSCAASTAIGGRRDCWSGQAQAARSSPEPRSPSPGRRAPARSWAPILTASAQRSGVGGGAFLLLSYSLGLALPFLLSAVAFERFAASFRWLRDHYTVITVISGLILIAVGVLVYRHEMPTLAGDLRQLMSRPGTRPGHPLGRALSIEAGAAAQISRGPARPSPAPAPDASTRAR